IGGGVSLIGEELFFAPLRRRVAEGAFEAFAGLTDIVPAALGEEGVVHGALALARQKLGGETGPMIRIKICGVTTPEDARFAADCGADAVGLNFYPKSPRFVTPQQAAAIVRALSPFTAPVGIFVGMPLRQVCAVAFQIGLRGVQTYDDQPPVEDPFPF